MADDNDDQRERRQAEASATATEERDERSDRLSDDEMREHNRRVDDDTSDDEARAERGRSQDMVHAERAMPPDDPGKAPDGGTGTLIARDKSDSFEERWTEIQARFVDDPQDAVKEADQLVGDVVDSITKTFGDERGRLERQWSEGGDVGTEELRVALQRYRTFFQRLLETAG